MMRVTCWAFIALALTTAHAQTSKNTQPLDAAHTLSWNLNPRGLQLWTTDISRSLQTRHDVPVPNSISKYFLRRASNNGCISDQDCSRMLLYVYTSHSVIYLLSIESLPESYERYSKLNTQPFALFFARTQDMGAHWFTSRNILRTPIGAEFVDNFAAVDMQHAWLIAANEPGAGQLPEQLLKTSDGGRSWQLAKAENMPIGHNGPQVLSVQSAKRAWFAGTCYGCEDPDMLIMTYTIDGGEHWVRTPLQWWDTLARETGTPDISSKDGGFHPSLNACVEITVRSEKSNTLKRSCTKDGGHTWQKPVAIKPEQIAP